MARLEADVFLYVGSAPVGGITPVTLDKSEGYHNRISYHDYAICAQRSIGRHRTAPGRIHPAGGDP